MKPIFDTTAPKKSTHLSINSDLLRQAKELEINLSQTLEEHLADLILQHRRQLWQVENREAIEAYNRKVAERGVFCEQVRKF